MTKRVILGAVVIAAVVGSTTALAQNTVTIAGSGSGAFETPPLPGAGVAWGSCTLNRVSNEMACSVRVHNIVDLRAGHIHVGGPGAAGPVIITIPNLPLSVSDDFALSWVWTERDVTVNVQAGVNKMADLIEACSSGNCYLNFHTAANPGGAIRINLCPQGPAPGSGQGPAQGGPLLAPRGRGANPFFAINVCNPAE